MDGGWLVVTKIGGERTRLEKIFEWRKMVQKSVEMIVKKSREMWLGFRVGERKKKANIS